MFERRGTVSFLNSRHVEVHADTHTHTQWCSARVTASGDRLSPNCEELIRIIRIVLIDRRATDRPSDGATDRGLGRPPRRLPQTPATGAVTPPDGRPVENKLSQSGAGN